MVEGSVTHTAYFVTGRAIATMSTSWSPSCRSGTEYDDIIVSRFTCPDTTIIGSESTNAPNTPVSAFVPPGPVVTCTSAGLVEQPRVPLRRHRACLLVMVRQPAHSFAAADGVVQVHRAAAGDDERIGDAVLHERAHDVVGEPDHCESRVEANDGVRESARR